MAKPNPLQAALERNKARDVEVTAPHDAPEIEATPKPAKRSRQTLSASAKHRGRVGLTTWQPEQAVQNLREISARINRPIQDLVLEALNDIFARHQFPQVRDD
jgi:hypothetical protein